MSTIRRQYTREFKQEAVQLLERSGRAASQLEAELGIGDGCLLRWQKALAAEGAQALPGTGHLRPEQEQLRQLQRENAVLREERDILKKALAIFSGPSR